MTYIKVENLSKLINSVKVLDNINLSLEKGRIYGFFGRNGSGKTMLFRAILGLIKASTGKILIDGKVLGNEIEFPNSCGVIIENPGFWEEYTGFKNLKLLASIKNEISDEEISKWMKVFDLDPMDKKVYRKYSLGMKQKLALTQAFMENPELLILDEPTNALDEESVKNVRKLILEEKEKGKIILIASHNKEDINLLSDEKFKLDKGHLSKFE